MQNLIPSKTERTKRNCNKNTSLESSVVKPSLLFSFMCCCRVCFQNIPVCKICKNIAFKFNCLDGILNVRFLSKVGRLKFKSKTVAYILNNIIDKTIITLPNTKGTRII